MLAKFIQFKPLGDEKGWLIALEGERNIPFAIKRAYYIYGTRPGVRRGRHAHRKLRQVIVCLAGTCAISLDDGRSTETVTLTGNERGLIIEPMIWHEMYDFSAGCVLLVLAEEWYDERDYIRDYQVFRKACK